MHKTVLLALLFFDFLVLGLFLLTYSVIWFSIYSVLWIEFTGPALFSAVKENVPAGQEKLFFPCCRKGMYFIFKTIFTILQGGN